MRFVVLAFVAITVVGPGCAFKLDRDRGLSPGEIQGTVQRSDAKNAPAQFAHLSIPGSLRVTRALKDGSFRIQGLPPGPVALQLQDDADGDGRPERAGFVGAVLPVDPDGKVGFVLMGDIGITGTFSVKGTVTITQGNATVTPAALGVVARVFATRGECFSFAGDTAPQADCTATDPNRLEVGAEAVTATDDTGAFEIDGLAAGHLALSVVFTTAMGNATLGPVVDVAPPVAVDGAPGDVVQAPIVLPGLAAALGQRIVTIAPNPPVANGTVVLRSVGTGGVSCDGSIESLPADAIVFKDAVHDGGEAALVVPLGAYDVTVCGDDGLSGTSGAQLALPPTSDTDVPRWVVMRFPGDPCIHLRAGISVTDCDDDNLPAIPPPAPQTLDLYAACQTQCWDGVAADLDSDSGSKTCSFGGITFDCDDDGDGQPDPTEPFQCQGPGKGTDRDGDFACTFADPSPTCTSNDPTLCVAGTNDVTPPNPTNPPIPLPGFWNPGPSLPDGRTATDAVAMPFVEFTNGSHVPTILGFALVNTRGSDGSVDTSGGLGFRFQSGAFETLPILDDGFVPFTGSASALVEAFGSASTASVGGFSAADGTTLATVRIFDAFVSSPTLFGISVSEQEIPFGATALGAVAGVLGSNPGGTPSTTRFLLAGGVDDSGAALDSIFIVDEAFISVGGAGGLLIDTNTDPTLKLVHARKSLHAVSVESPPLAFFIGGEDAAGPIAATEIVHLDDPNEPTAEASPPSLATARTGFTVVGSEPDVVIMGGRDAAGHVLDSVEIVSFASGAPVVSAGTSLLTARADHAATLLDADHILVTGGFDDAGHPVASAELFTRVGDAWTPIKVAAELKARGLHQAIPLPNGSVIVVGGKDAPGGNDVGTTELFSLLPPSSGEGEGEGEGAAEGEGEGEGQAQLPCATEASATVPIISDVRDAVFADGRIYLADAFNGVIAVDVSGGALDVQNAVVVVSDPTVRDLTFNADRVVASGGEGATTGVVHVINPSLTPPAHETDIDLGFEVGAGHTASSGIAIQSDEIVILDSSDGTLQVWVDSDGNFPQGSTGNRQFGVPNAGHLLFADDGASGVIVTLTHPATGAQGWDTLPLPFAQPQGTSSTTLTEEHTALIAADQTITVAVNFDTNASFDSTAVENAQLIGGSSVNQELFTPGFQARGLAFVGTHLVAAGNTAAGGRAVLVFDETDPGAMAQEGGALALDPSAVTDVVVDIDATHAYVPGANAVIDVSACTP